MKNITAAILAIAALPAASPAAAQQTQKLTAERHNEYGLVYSLPTTRLAVKVTARKTVEFAGPYWQYAKKFIGTDRVITADKSSWTITKVEIEPFGVPDDSRQYLMQLKPGAATFLTVDSDGMLLAINAPAESERPEIVAEETTIEDFDMNEYLQYVNEDFLSSQSMAKQAQMLAESIMEVRDAKIALTRGTADNMPTDGRQLELMLNSLAHQEQAMTAAFTGHSDTCEATTTVYFTPGDEGRQTLLRISDFDGFTASDDYAGEPLYIEVKGIREAELPADEKGETKKMPRDAVAYVIPGSAEVTLSFGGKKLLQREIDCAQYGVVFGLNPTLFTDKKSPSYATFNPATGAVEKIGPVSELGE